MRNFVLAVPRLVRDDVHPVHPRSKSADDLLPRTRAKDAPPGFQRRASAEGSTGWDQEAEKDASAGEHTDDTYLDSKFTPLSGLHFHLLFTPRKLLELRLRPSVIQAIKDLKDA
ncbi:hypothetical protein T484DRAFT_1913242 [Baffinella frigidus]|nr:hypothetical protein T484DRAFT_1913242 [Cryptophyta sp. CCMP2293]